MEPNIEELRKNYQSFPDEKLIRLASEDATGLRPEALELLKEIIKERGLSQDITKGIDVQFRQVTDKELLQYAELLRKQPCPVCNSVFNKLNATVSSTVMSFLVLTNTKKKFLIACPACLDKENNNAILKSSLMGWWGLPWGIIRTPGAIFFNIKMKKQNNIEEPNDTLLAFVKQRIGRIEANKNNQEGLNDIVAYIR